MKEGEMKAFLIPFANIGETDLEIELATACKCTEVEWPRQAIPPNYSSQIYVIFDSTDFSGEVVKVVDIIANTEAVVTEAWFKVTVEKAD